MKRLPVCVLSLTILGLIAGLAQAQTGNSSGSPATTSQGAAQAATQPKAHDELASRPDAWRYKFHNAQWWYYHPNNTWSTWNGTAWTPYTGVASANSGLTTAPTAGMSATDALPGRSNQQMSGGGMGLNGSPMGGGGRHSGVPNLDGGMLNRGINANRVPSATDALPGRSNLQMSGGGLGVNGSAVGGSTPIATPGASAGNISATDALPGEPDRQMSGGGLGVNGSAKP